MDSSRTERRRFQFAFHSVVAGSSQYRPDIDGLRAVAVLSVVFFHAKLFALKGGFVGVDIFFVISGYLITLIIAKEMLLGRFSFIDFYERRMRRIFPALFFLLSLCTLIAAILFAPSDLLVFAKALIATTCFLSNFFFLRHSTAGGYFGNISEFQALLHTWSLAVEEQFYLLFPAVLLIIIKWSKQRTAQVLTSLALLSFLSCVWLTRHHASAAFYMLLPRAWELLMGSLLAVKAFPMVSGRAPREIGGTAGLALTICAVFMFTDQTPFPGWHAVIPCLGACLIIYAGEQKSSWVNILLSFPPLVFIGVISYSLYLWHWPLIVFAKYFLGRELAGTEALGVVLASLLMAFISFELVESRFRGRNSTFSRRQIFSLGLAASTGSLILGIILVGTGGLPQRYDPSTRSLVLANSARRDDFEEVCSNWKTNPRSFAEMNVCNLGAPNSHKILFWGDSHIQQLYPIVDDLYQKGELQNYGATFAIANSCPPTEHLNGAGGGLHCDTISTIIMSRAEQPDIDTVMIGFNTYWSYNEGSLCPSVNGKCVARASDTEIRSLFLVELSDHIRRLRALGKRVIVCLPFPAYDRSVPLLEIRNAAFARFGLAGAAVDKTLPDLREQIIESAKTSNAAIFDPRASLCRNDHCINEINGVSIYTDNNHIAASQIGILEDMQALPYRYPQQREYGA